MQSSPEAVQNREQRLEHLPNGWPSVSSGGGFPQSTLFLLAWGRQGLNLSREAPRQVRKLEMLVPPWITEVFNCIELTYPEMCQPLGETNRRALTTRRLETLNSTLYKDDQKLLFKAGNYG